MKCHAFEAKRNNVTKKYLSYILETQSDTVRIFV